MAKKKENLNILDVLKAEFGDEHFESSADVEKVIPTGSLSLDVSTGVGGIPVGRFTAIYGPESSGKTTLALSIAREALKLEGSVLFIDMEQTLHSPYANKIMGEYYDNEKFIIARPKTAEQAFNICETAIGSGELSLIIFDSIGSILPEKELEDDFGDRNVALAARLVTTFLRRNGFLVRQHNISFVFINQVRDKIGSYFGVFEMPGGHALKHWASIVIRLFKGKDIEDSDKNKIASNFKYYFEKNKVGIPYRSGEFPIIFGEGIDYYRDVLNFASMLGVVASRGPYKAFGDDTIGLGIDNSITELKENSDLLDKIEKMCYNVAKAKKLPHLGTTASAENGKEENSEA